MSRLTYLDFMSGYFPQEDVIDTECFDKLGRLEDLMEEYGLHSIDNLELALSLWAWTSKNKPNQLVDKLLQENTELKKKLKNAIRFKTPQIERFAVVQYMHRKGKPYKIEHCYDTYKDENMNTVYCYYDCDSYNFRVIQICDTKEEAQAKLEELKGENK